MPAPKSLIINSPFECPQRHWADHDGRLVLTNGRRPAGYEVFDTRTFTRRTEPLDAVMRIRERVDVWRGDNYPGVTSVTRGLLEHWYDREEMGLDMEEATRWIEGLDRVHKTRRVQRCFDLSATPFAPTGRANTEKGLFGWIVSDFGLNDAIEAGLVKTPRVVVRDDALPNAATLRSKLYHLYRENEVKEDLNRRGAQPHEALPKLVQDAYTLLGADWRATRQAWME